MNTTSLAVDPNSALISPPMAESENPAVWLETPVLRFVDVTHGSSQVEPIVFRAIGNVPLDAPNLETGSQIEVVMPPLAPFSLAPSPNASFSSRGSMSGVVDWAESDIPGEVRAELWIRYDATSAMATDIGQVTLRHRGSGQEWRVELEGIGRLANNPI